MLILTLFVVFEGVQCPKAQMFRKRWKLLEVFVYCFSMGFQNIRFRLQLSCHCMFFRFKIYVTEVNFFEIDE